MTCPRIISAALSVLVFLVPHISLAQEHGSEAHEHGKEHGHESHEGHEKIITTFAEFERLYKNGTVEEKKAALSSAYFLETKQESLRAVPMLLEAVKADDAALRAAAFRSLGLMKGAPPEVLAAVEAGLDDADFLAKVQSVIGTGRLLEDKRKPMPKLVAMLSHADLELRMRAAEALDRIGEPGEQKQALCVLATVLEVRIRLNLEEKSVHPFGYQGARRLDFRGTREEDKVRNALRSCKDMKAVSDAVFLALPHRAPLVRLVAAKALGWIGPDKDVAVPKILERLGSEDDPLVRYQLINNLAQKDYLTPEALKALQTAVKSSDPGERRAVYETLSKGKAAEVLPLAREGFKDKEILVRLAAYATIAGFGKESTNEVPLLAKALEDGERELREVAAIVAVLRDIGTDEARNAARAYVERLQKQEAEKKDAESKKAGNKSIAENKNAAENKRTVP